MRVYKWPGDNLLQRIIEQGGVDGSDTGEFEPGDCYMIAGSESYLGLRS
jgi:hypothetical protein